ncbi:type II toxin-antitoxin system RelE/ParE family toxin [bacterium]|nr:MAG: type II toxin-antitoxin system RelE/ParE family toxin [bacterium]
MTIRYSKKFRKQYKKLTPKMQQKTTDAIKLWSQKPNDESLRLHKLSGKMSRFYSIDIAGDLRALYEIVDNEVFLYQMVGTHSQLYG